MRWIFLVFSNFLVINLIVAFVLIGSGHNSFNISEKELADLSYGVDQQHILARFGEPYLRLNNRWIYRGEGESLLTVEWSDQKLVYAELNLTRFVNFKSVSHIENNRLMALETPKELMMSGWLKIGVPKQGVILHVNRNGEVGRLIWGKPWSPESKERGILTILDRLNELPPFALN